MKSEKPTEKDSELEMNKTKQTKKNIVYKTDWLARYFSENRVKWQHFYESERIIIDQLHLDSSHTVLDIGCGCGGLGLALREKFDVDDYTGVEINSPAAEAGRAMNQKANIFCGDILDLSQNELKDKHFNVVFSLSCVDWNVRFSDMLAAAWNHVLPGGYLVSTFRLTEGEGCNDIKQSYQYINFDEILEGEIASYVVLNAEDLLQQLSVFNPSEIRAYGYWGTPSATAVTLYDKLCFAAFSIRKRSDDIEPPRYNLSLPAEILSVMGGPTR
jgi:SAM-dependent methyltransferase